MPPRHLTRGHPCRTKTCLNGHKYGRGEAPLPQVLVKNRVLVVRIAVVFSWIQCNLNRDDEGGLKFCVRKKAGWRKLFPTAGGRVETVSGRKMEGIDWVDVKHITPLVRKYASGAAAEVFDALLATKTIAHVHVLQRDPMPAGASAADLGDAGPLPEVDATPISAPDSTPRRHRRSRRRVDSSGKGRVDTATKNSSPGSAPGSGRRRKGERERVGGDGCEGWGGEADDDDGGVRSLGGAFCAMDVEVRWRWWESTVLK